MNNITLNQPLYSHMDDSKIFIMIALIFMVLLFCGLIKMLFVNNKDQITPQIAVLIEIPIAISISNQTVDNEHIGVVI
jgi:hypothetical protein